MGASGYIRGRLLKTLE